MIILQVETLLLTRFTLLNDRIFATEACIRDTLRNIIRTTDFELGHYYNDEPGMGPKMKAKALRFHVEQLHSFGTSQIHHEDRYEIENNFINPFWLAVQLDRCFERSTLLAHEFTELLVDVNIVPDDIENAYDLIKFLKQEIDGDFTFRSAPKEIYKLENESVESNRLINTEYWEEYYDKLG